MLLLLSALGLIGIFYAVWLAMQISVPKAKFALDSANNVLLVSYGELRGAPVATIGTSGVPAESTLLIEDMDALPDYAAQHRFLADQSAIANAMRDGVLELRLQDGHSLSVPVVRRSILELPFLFWFQHFCGYTALLIGAALWIFGRDRVAGLSLAVMGAGLYMATWSAAVYGTRGLAMDGDQFAILAVINRGGSIFYDCFLAAIFWFYPHRLGSTRRALAMAAIVAFTVWLADSMELGDSHNTTYFVPFFMVFLVAMLLAARQWRGTASEPLTRAALKWLLLSIFAGTVLFSVVVLVPAMLQMEAFVGAQAVMMGALLMVHVGLAFGIIRYRLFDLDRWWFAIWLWVLGGSLVIALDLLLLSLWQWPQTLALPVTLFIAGGLYFPLRQWLWMRLLGRRKPDMNRYYGRLAELSACSDEPAALEEGWSQLLREMFRPLQMSVLKEGCQEVEWVESGQALKIPTMMSGKTIMLSHAAQGKRLFNRDDCAIVEQYLELGRHMAAAVHAKQSAVNEERRRIMDDLHDELGGKLLELMCSSKEPGFQSLARSALQDMRELVRAGKSKHVNSEHLFADLRIELMRQVQAAQLSFSWDVDVAALPRFSGDQALQLRRIIKEAVTNAIRHAAANSIAITATYRGDSLQVSVIDDGIGCRGISGDGGSGLANMRLRAVHLGAEISWQKVESGGCEVRLLWRA
ncbi:hypothetical protein FE236_00265 [Mariprofundus erugo]|uniref:sensor histidine kinase n=1 Tax=Mariprofundus erugo TaxID=2528639 RepID=UPI0010FDAB01|nr:ATP-binding protein [Mariprofundus erugo]TLS78227.1 hypothetical protein FE236_00265 [Mariprofundus erugo]